MPKGPKEIKRMVRVSEVEQRLTSSKRAALVDGPLENSHKKANKKAQRKRRKKR